MFIYVSLHLCICASLRLSICASVHLLYICVSRVTSVPTFDRGNRFSKNDQGHQNYQKQFLTCWLDPERAVSAKHFTRVLEQGGHLIPFQKREDEAIISLGKTDCLNTNQLFVFLYFSFIRNKVVFSLFPSQKVSQNQTEGLREDQKQT